MRATLILLFPMLLCFDTWGQNTRDSTEFDALALEGHLAQVNALPRIAGEVKASRLIQGLILGWIADRDGQDTAQAIVEIARAHFSASQNFAALGILKSTDNTVTMMNDGAEEYFHRLEESIKRAIRNQRRRGKSRP